jgi:hypothetical protein
VVIELLRQKIYSGTLLGEVVDVFPVRGIQRNGFRLDENVVISKRWNGCLLELDLARLLNDDCVVFGHFVSSGGSSFAEK